MLFSKADRERLERIDKNLLEVYPRMGQRTDGKSLHQVAGNIEKYLGEFEGRESARWMEVGLRLQAIEQSQGKLLAALNDIQERLPTKLFAELASVNQALDRMTLAQGGAVSVLSGQIKGLGDGLADEIRKLRDEVSDLHPVVLPLTCGDCGRDLDHCKCEVFAAHNPYAKPQRKRKRKRGP